MKGIELKKGIDFEIVDGQFKISRNPKFYFITKNLEICYKYCKIALHIKPNFIERYDTVMYDDDIISFVEDREYIQEFYEIVENENDLIKVYVY